MDRIGLGKKGLNKKGKWMDMDNDIGCVIKIGRLEMIRGLTEWKLTGESEKCLLKKSAFKILNIAKLSSSW